MAGESGTEEQESGPDQGCEPAFDPGVPAAPDRWRAKLQGRVEMLRYLRSAERYWYSTEWYGSERRRTKA